MGLVRPKTKFRAFFSLVTRKYVMAEPNKPVSSFGFRPEYSVLGFTSLSPWNGKNLVNDSPILYDANTGGFKAGAPGSINGGDVLGPNSATDRAVPVFNLGTGKLLKNSGVTISDSNEVFGVSSLSMAGSAEGLLTVRPAEYTQSHTLVMPYDQGAPGTVLTNDGTGMLQWSSVSGNVIGPPSSTNNAVPRFDGTYLKDSGVIIDDDNAVSGIKSLSVTSISGSRVTIEAGAIVDYGIKMPVSQGGNGTALVNNGSGTLSWVNMGTVTGPSAGSTDNAVARFDLVSGKLLQDSNVTISDNGDIAGVGSLAINGATSGRLTLQAAAVTSDHSLTLPPNQGAADTVLSNDGSGVLAWTVPADVFGPASATDKALARFDLVSGKLIQNSVATLSDAGDLTGIANITVAGKVTGLLPPTGASDAVNKSYVDAAVSGLKYKAPVVAASTADVPLLSGLLTIDAVPLNATDRVLLKNQNTGTENGIYVAAAGAWSRAADLAAGASAKNAAVTVISGTDNGKKSFVCTNTAGSDVVGTDALTFVLFQANADGDVVGPGAAVDNSIARFDTTTGKLIQSSGVTISDTADIAGAKTIALSGSGSGVLTVQAAAITSSHALTMPAVQGVANSFLRNNGTGSLSWASVGNVSGPSSSTPNGIARYDLGSGKIIKNSGVTISDSGDVAGVWSLGMTGSSANTLTLTPSPSTTNYALTFPPGQGSADSYLKNDGNGGLSWAEVSLSTLGAGDVLGPTSSTTDSIAIFNSETGKLLKGSNVTITSDEFNSTILNMNGGRIENLRMLKFNPNGRTVALQASPNTSQNYGLTLPPAIGRPGQFLATSGFGLLTWSETMGIKDLKQWPLEGTFEYSPSPGTSRAVVYVTGGGAAGAGTNSFTGSHGAGSGGGGGGTAIAYLDIAPVGGLEGSGTGTVGAGGLGAPGGPGGNGEQSTFSFTSGSGVTVTITASGGAAAASASSITNPFLRLNQGGNGGLIPYPEEFVPLLLAFLKVDGGQGGQGMAIGYQVVSAGAGGSSFWGAGGAATTINGAVQNSHGTTATNFGAGGSGAVMTNSGSMSGGNGKHGVIVIYEY
jgi:hypothetical protein